jgi:hypothetical protein
MSFFKNGKQEVPVWGLTPVGCGRMQEKCEGR